jgi:uncharacterized Zn finger protein (UPF0148 family)
MPFQKDEDELGVLWMKDSAAGKVFMSGSVTCPACAHEQRVVVFSTPSPKKHEKMPDWRILKSQPRDGAAAPAPASAAPRTARMVPRDDIPF